jgi:hypothetical protein
MEITSGKQWRSAGVPRQLPSGKVALLRRPSVFTMLSDEDAPDFLKQIVIDNIQGHKSSNGKEFKITTENLPQLTRMLERVCRACFANPRIVDAPETDDEIAITDVEDTDKMEVLTWWIGGRLGAAQTFPAQQMGDVGAVANGDSVQPAPLANGGGEA